VRLDATHRPVLRQLVAESQLVDLLPIIVATVESEFEVPASYVSIEVPPQSPLAVNRAVVELELHARPSDLRAQVVVQLCRHLHADVQEYLADHGVSGRVGVFGRLFGAAAYIKR
jgi:hypothetical protein